ncbi:hypothetical protein CI109_105701 [Kwoniella shandongensis]|uniref:Uncharacterized protein n=1 Tax=Kwoniella shandongensis TaxID=1734106 RepID=A0AAJ8LNP9_9TREE
MIRVTSVPVLLVIALYERQSYRDQSLMEQFGDFAERYVGNLPRKIKAAAGFENFGNRRDIETVFEIEREVGSFYHGWDDDGMDDQDFELPPAFEAGSSSSDEDDSPSEAKKQATEATPPTSARHARFSLSSPSTQAPMTASPSRLEHDIGEPRLRRNSMPSPRPEQRQIPPPPQPFGRPRRNSSIHGPSPLAQLFVRSPEGDRGLRRNSMAGMALSSSQPTLSSMLGPMRPRTKSHSRSNTQPESQIREELQSSASAKPPHKLYLPTPSVPPIEEGRGSTLSRFTSESRDQSPSPSIETKPKALPDSSNKPKSPPQTTRSVRFPVPEIHSPFGPSPSVLNQQAPPSGLARSKSQPHGTGIVKASQVEAMEMSRPEEESSMKSKLEEMDKRQRKMEEMLERLLSRLGSG